MCGFTPSRRSLFFRLKLCKPTNNRVWTKESCLCNYELTKRAAALTKHILSYASVSACLIISNRCFCFTCAQCMYHACNSSEQDNIEILHSNWNIYIYIYVYIYIPRCYQFKTLYYHIYFAMLKTSLKDIAFSLRDMNIIILFKAWGN